MCFVCLLFVVFLLAGACVLKACFWPRAHLLLEATWIPDRLLVGEKLGGNSVFPLIIPDVDPMAGSQADFSSLPAGSH